MFKVRLSHIILLFLYVKISYQQTCGNPTGPPEDGDLVLNKSYRLLNLNNYQEKISLESLGYKICGNVKDTYWCPGWWPWQWFNFCTKIVYMCKWCYNFYSIQETDYLFVAYLKGCENKIEYTWFAGVFNIGSACCTNIIQCFDNPLSSSGSCPGGC